MKCYTMMNPRNLYEYSLLILLLTNPPKCLRRVKLLTTEAAVTVGQP
jgi:hypothetical protein